MAVPAIASKETRPIAPRADAEASRALSALERQLKDRPEDPQLLLEHGQLLWQLGRAQDALGAFRRVIAAKPDSAAAHNNIAVVLASQGRVDEARSSLESALKTHDAYATIHENLAHLYAHQAGQAYRRALAVDGPSASEPTKPRSARLRVKDEAAHPQLALVSRDLAPSRPDTASLAKAPVPSPPVVLGPTPTPAPVAPVTVAAAPSPAPGATANAASPTPASAPTSTPTVASAPVPSPAPAPASGTAAATPGGPSASPTTVAPEPAPAASASAARSDAQRAAEQALKAWAAAWSGKDMKGYVAAYVPNFRGSASSHGEWRTQRAQRIEPRKRIDVQVSEVKAVAKGDRIEASFRQQYTSESLSVRSRREVVLARVGDHWLIESETGR